ncbi:phosphatase and actin regulator 2 [Trichonephila clavipes]|nr:phosphatase and actin regulator 2 [Trichonephila clavipes]
MEHNTDTPASLPAIIAKPSYAQVASSPAAVSSFTIPPPPSEKVLLVRPLEHNAGSSTTRNKITSFLLSKNLPFTITRIKNINNGGIAICLTTDEDVSKLSQELSNNADFASFSISKPVRRKPQFILFGVDSSYNKDSITKALLLKNDIFKDGGFEVNFSIGFPGSTTFRRNPIFKIGSNSIHISKSYKYLGVIIDNRLSWTPHINSIKDKIFWISSNFYRVSKNFNHQHISLMKLWYTSVVPPIISYGAGVWGGSLTSIQETATHIDIREAEDWFRPFDLAKECDIYISSRSGSLLCKKVNGAVKTSSVGSNSRSPSPSPMEETYNTVVVTNSGFPTVLSSSQNHAMPVIHNVSLLKLPDVEEVHSHEGEIVLFVLLEPPISLNDIGPILHPQQQPHEDVGEKLSSSAKIMLC